MTIGFITFFSIPGKPKKLMQEYTSARPKTNSVPKAHQAVWLWKKKPEYSPDPKITKPKQAALLHFVAMLSMIYHFPWE